MSTPVIILLAVLAVLIIAAGLYFLSWRSANKQAEKHNTVGTVMGWQKSKIPFLGQIVIQYTKKGKPYQVGSSLRFKPRKLKEGAKGRWTIYTYRFKGKAPTSMARRYKAPRPVPGKKKT